MIYSYYIIYTLNTQPCITQLTCVINTFSYDIFHYFNKGGENLYRQLYHTQSAILYWNNNKNKEKYNDYNT